MLGWLVAIIAFLIACARCDHRRKDLHPLRLGWTAGDTVILVAALAIAAALRVPALERLPATMLGDEGAMGLEALRVIEGRYTDPFATGWHSHPLLWFWLQSWSLRAFGDSLGGLRMLSALVGSVTVATTYLLARLLYGRRVAVIAALLLATYHFHIHFSRLALFNIADPLLGTSILSALVIGLRTRRALAFGAAGVMLGFTLYFYPGARLFILLLLLLGGGWVLPRVRDRRAAFRREHFIPALIIMAGALIAAAPLLQTYSAEPRDFSARLRADAITEPGWLRDEARGTGRTKTQVLLSQLAGAALAFTSYPNRDGFYDQRRPLLWGLAAPLMLGGLLLALLRSRQWEYRIPLLWLALAIVFGGILLKNPPQSARYVTLTPVVCLLIAFFIAYTLQVLEHRVPGRRYLPRLLAGLFVGYLAMVSVVGYFRDYLPREQLGGPSTHAANALADYLRRQPAGARVWFLGMPRMYYHGFPLLDFLARNVDAADALTIWVMPAPEAGRTTIYAVLPERRAELEATMQRYPGGEQAALTWPPDPGPLVYVYRVATPATSR